MKAINYESEDSLFASDCFSLLKIRKKMNLWVECWHKNLAVHDSYFVDVRLQFIVF